MDTLTGMRTFVTVVKAGSFTAAAKRLGMSKALASKYVVQLEQRLGVRLLNRSTRHLGTTEAGQAYFERCQRLLEEFDELEAALRDRQGSPQGRLVITAPQTFGEQYVTQAVAAFMQRYPRVAVDLCLTDRFVDLVEEGFDLGVRIGTLTDSSLVSRRLASIRMVVCATPDYLARHGAPTQPSELRAHACVIDSNVDAAWPFRVDGRRQSVDVAGRFRANSARAARDMVMAGAGIGLCPAYAVAEDIRAGRLRVLLEEYEALEHGLYLVYPHRQYLAAKVRAFNDFLSGYFGDHPRWAWP